MGWGRATSTDLLNWRDEGVAIESEEDGWIYSGCVVPNGERTHAFFTLHRPSSNLQGQAEALWCGAWQRVPGECVPAQAESRDPFVFRWRDEWRMLLAQPPPWDEPTRHPARLMLLRSADLATWHQMAAVGPQTELGEMFETPLLRRLPVEGEAIENWPWLLAVGVVDRRGGEAICGTRAWFGRFDGSEFVAAGAPFLLDHGPDFYAPAAWAGTADNESIITGWNNSWSYARLLPSKAWSGGAHGLPRRLDAVRDGHSGWLLSQRPAALPDFGHGSALPSGRHAVGTCTLVTITGEGTLRLGDLTLHLKESDVLLERTCARGPLAGAGFPGRWFAPRSGAPLKWLLDGCVAEMFAEDGSAWMSALTLREPDDRLEVSRGLHVTLQVTV
jgi:sucrose-6-phosphate hydrolase SacC (GH32 family)